VCGGGQRRMLWACGETRVMGAMCAWARRLLAGTEGCASLSLGRWQWAGGNGQVIGRVREGKGEQGALTQCPHTLLRCYCCCSQSSSDSDASGAPKEAAKEDAAQEPSQVR